MRSAIVAMFIGLMAAGMAAGAEGMTGSVSGGGYEEFKTLPDEMRMSVMLQVTGKTGEEAIAAYRERAEAAKKMFTEAGAVAETVKTESPRLVQGESPSRR